jgi:hypothetical protein
MEKEVRIMNYEFLCIKVISAVMMVEFISDRMAYIMLRGCWCDIIVLNVHAPKEDITDDIKDSFYEELKCVSNKFPKYHKNFVRFQFLN